MQEFKGAFLYPQSEHEPKYNYLWLTWERTSKESVSETQIKTAEIGCYQAQTIK